MRRFQITTPEQVVFHYELAGLATRGSAWAIDWLLLMAARAGWIWAALAYGGVFGMTLVFTGLFALNFGYFLCFEIFWAGQSPGKRMLRLRVISAGGGKLGATDIMLRNLLRIVDSPMDILPIGGLVALLDERHRRLGDLAAETLVIRTARTEIPAMLAARQDRLNSFESDAAVRGRILSRVTREERDLILDLMMRRDELETAQRERLFGEAASFFRRRFGLPEGIEHLSDEQVVLNLALVLCGLKIAG